MQLIANGLLELPFTTTAPCMHPPAAAWLLVCTTTPSLIPCISIPSRLC